MNGFMGHKQPSISASPNCMLKTKKDTPLKHYIEDKHNLFSFRFPIGAHQLSPSVLCGYSEIKNNELMVMYRERDQYHIKQIKIYLQYDKSQICI